MSARLLASGIVALFVLSTVAAAQPSGNSSANWVTAGPVYAVARSGSTVFLGGDFNAIAPRTNQVGAFVVFHGGGTRRMCPMPPVNGSVYAIAHDGAGGFFVGGRFDRIGNTERHNLARVSATCVVDAAWSGVVDGPVNTLALVGGVIGTLYVGGSFTQAGQQGGSLVPRTNLASFNGAGGVLTTWNPSANGEVNALQVFEASSSLQAVVYVGGNFTFVGGQPRERLGAVDLTGAATTFVADANARVLALQLDVTSTESRLLVGGEFTTLAGASRNRIGLLLIDSDTVTVDPAFNPDANGTVRAIAALSPGAPNSRVYLGGDFTQVGGAAKNYAAAISFSGVALPFNPDPDGPVHTVALDSVAGTSISVGGDFTRLGGARRLNAGRVDPDTGSTLAWDPAFNGPVHVIAPDRVNFGPFTPVAVGGDFDAIGAQLRHNLAAIHLDTGELLPFAPHPDGAVRALTTVAGVLYVGGDFRHVESQPREHLASLTVATRSLTAWSPNPDGPVHAIEVGSGTLFVGGNFANIAAVPRGRVAAIDASTGVVTSWTPPDFDAVVRTLAPDSDFLYVGGSFTTAGGSPALHLARLSLATGARDLTWAPSPDGEVRAICVGTLGTNTVYAGGLFSMAAGVPRSNLVELDKTIGLATAWQPEPNGAVNALACWPSLYAGGAFTTVGTGTAQQTRRRVAQLSTSAAGATGIYATSFAPVGLGVVRDIAANVDGVFATAAGESTDHDEPVARLAFFAIDFAGAPGAPTLPSVTSFAVSPSGGNGLVRLRWAPPARGPRPASYRIYAGSSPGASNYANGFEVTANQLDAVVPFGISVFVRVQAVNAFGGSTLSEEVQLITSGLCSTPPNPPEMTATVDGSNVTLNWTPSSGESATSYRLDAGFGSGRSDLVAVFLATQTSLSVTAPAGVYYVRIRATGACGTSLASSEVVVATAGSTDPVTPPIAGANVGSQNSVAVMWTPPAVGTAIAYRLEAGTGFRLSDLGSITTTRTNLDFVGVPPGTYYLRVYAIGSTGATAPSDEVIYVRH